MLARLGPVGRIVSSPLGRCRRLAELIGVRRGLPVTVDPRWREMDFGRWEGRPWEAIPRAEIDAWATDLLHARPHGGESVAMLRTRTRAVVEETLAAGVPCLAVTHAGVIRAARMAAGEAAWDREICFGEAVIFSSDGALAPQKRGIEFS